MTSVWRLIVEWPEGTPVTPDDRYYFDGDDGERHKMAPPLRRRFLTRRAALEARDLLARYGAHVTVQVGTVTDWADTPAPPIITG
jgi:hypothetical protein